MGIDAGADRGTALCKVDEPFQRAADTLARMLGLRAPTVEFLPERDGHGVHQVRPTCLDDVAQLVRFRLEHATQVLERRQELLVNRKRCTYVHAGRNHVVAGLAHVDVVVGVHRGAELFGREMCNDFVGIHVRAGTRPGLEYVDRKMGVVLPVSNFQ